MNSFTKKSWGLFILLFHSVLSIAQCDLTVSLTDTFGDGWNGGTVTVQVNGIDILTNITIVDGFGPELYTIAVNSGDNITVIRTNDGSWPSEMRVEVYNDFCNTLYGEVEPNSAGVTFEAICNAQNSEYTVVGNASSPEPHNCVILTTATNSQRGCAWQMNTTLDFTEDFTYDLSINMGSDPNGADGLCFVIHNDPDGLCACGGVGGGMGAQGILNSLIVEIDTYLNAEDRDDGIPSVLCNGGPNPHHMDIWLDGNVNPPGGACPGNPGPRIIPAAQPLLDEFGAAYISANGLDHTMRISWNSATNTFTAQLMDALPTLHSYAIVSHSFDPLTVFGTETPYFGFTASTGGLNNEHSFCLPDALLPINLVEFEVVCNNDDVYLNWTTSSEVNNQKFVIEKSKDLQTIIKVGELEGAGNSSEVINYHFIDREVMSGTWYYRITQFDYDGVYKSYAWKSLDCYRKVDIPLIYPNPNEGLLFLMLPESYSDLDTKFVLYDLSGRTVYQDIMNVDINQVQSFDLSGYSVGVYQLMIVNEKFKTIYPIILK